MAFKFSIDPKKRASARFMNDVQREIIRAFIEEKKATGINQGTIAKALGVNRSVVSRLLKGEGDLTLRSVAEISWALGWSPNFQLRRDHVVIGKFQETAIAYVKGKVEAIDRHKLEK